MRPVLLGVGELRWRITELPAAHNTTSTQDGLTAKGEGTSWG